MVTKTAQILAKQACLFPLQAMTMQRAKGKIGAWCNLIQVETVGTKVRSVGREEELLSNLRTDAFIELPPSALHTVGS